MKTNILLVMILLASKLMAQVPAVTKLEFPDINGFFTMTCDLHSQTMFSDGKVWPTVRIDEAFNEGLDVISITDHIEYLPHAEYLKMDHNTSYEIAKDYAKEMNILLIKGTEITRDMPPGHFNAIFIKDANKMETPNVKRFYETKEMPEDKNFADVSMAIEEATKQGAFVFWNHPGWVKQAPNGTIIYDIHKEYIKKGWIMGIEVANWDEWYLEALQWCIDYNLTVLGNSDIHEPISSYYLMAKQKHRTVTLVFAEEKTEKGIHDALLNDRTAVYYDGKFLAKQKKMDLLMNAIVENMGKHYTDKDNNKFYQIRNNSSANLTLNNNNEIVILPAYGSIVVKFEPNETKKEYIVENSYIDKENKYKLVISAN